MNKLILAVLTFLVFTFVGNWVVSEQSPTSTAAPTQQTSPSPTGSDDQTPQGAPQTGFGTAR